jgi:hypothetical protein
MLFTNCIVAVISHVSPMHPIRDIDPLPQIAVNSYWSFSFYALVWALALLAGGCQFENTGSTRKSAEVAQAFETVQFQGFPGYRYYFLNQENNPFGAAGLEEGYWMKDPGLEGVQSRLSDLRQGGRAGPAL